jgi:hypothetical protein
MVPMRGIFEWLGYSVGYDKGTITAQPKCDGEDHSHRITMQVKVSTASVGDKHFTLQVPPVLDGSAVYVPLRFVAEASGAAVEFDGAANKITLTHGDLRGCLSGPTARPPARYTYDGFMACAVSEEKLGDKAQRSSQPDAARSHYQAALKAARAIDSYESDAKQVPGEAATSRAAAAIMSENFDLAQRILASANGHSQRAAERRDMKAWRTHDARARKAVDMASRLQRKIAKLPPQSPE